MKLIVNASGYVGQSGGAGGAGIFLQYLLSQLTEKFDVDVLIAPKSKNFRSGDQSKARFIELPYLTAETLRHLRDGPTVVLDPFGALPCKPFPDDMALCVMVHDLMHLERPHFFTAAEREGRSASFADGIQRADAVVTPSADQARAIRHYFPGSQPVVIHHLPFMTLKSTARSTDAAALPAGLGDFILFPAVKWPHKNHKTVIEAFTAYIKRTGSQMQLVLCGGPCAENRFSFYPSNQSLTRQIIDLGIVDDELLRALFSQAKAVLFPTMYEGFGIPVLEAAHLGKMVVASHLNVFDEILGESNYRHVDDSLCHVRWMEAFADIESPTREIFENKSRLLQDRTDVHNFVEKYSALLKTCAERYTHPTIYPVRGFPSGDRLNSSLLTSVDFADLYGVTTIERGSRHAALGAKPAVQISKLYRSLGASPESKTCLRAQFEVPKVATDGPDSLQFSAWVRLLSDANILDELHWSVNDQGVRNVLPLLQDGEWHLIRASVPHTGVIDFRGLRGGQSEASGFDIEIHDPSILRLTDIAPPKEASLVRHLTILVAALSDSAKLDQVLEAISELNDALPFAISGATWVVITSSAAIADEFSAKQLPPNIRVLVVDREHFSRSDATALITPYEPISHLLLLEETDLASALEQKNLDALAAALSPSPIQSHPTLTLKSAPGFWSLEERGKIIDLTHRVGQPVPLLDPKVIHASFETERPRPQPRFAVIETDRTSNISHHGTVSSLFLNGAKSLGFQPVLGLHHAAGSGIVEDVEVWAEFSPQVYTVGSADSFAEQLSRFIAETGLGPDDVVFMHSLSPQIVLGIARFIAANPDMAPRFVMRFFSTAEAMRGHRLSYVKILRSIESVRVLRQKMHFFCESKNLIDYYEKQVGRRYPLLFNPEHPSLAMVRESDWYDPNLGGGNAKILAYFGEAREEKGFDEIPGIISNLLNAETMADFQFLIQTGSNRGNDTPKMSRAKAALGALKKKFPDRIRTFESVETPEQFYFLMKHAKGIIAPYSRSAYGKRGTGVTLEALQMGLTVFAFAETDLYATFSDTGRVIGVKEGESFAEVITQFYASATPSEPTTETVPLSLSPGDVCTRLLSLCVPDPVLQASRPAEPILWVGNDTFGEGCSVVYASQKRALRELGRDCFELFVPWPDPNWVGSDSGAYDERIYGFESLYESAGLAWVAIPSYTPALFTVLDEIQRTGPTYQRLHTLNGHLKMPATLQKAITNNRIQKTLLNYAHLYPVIEEMVPYSQIVCETHDIVAYQHAVRRGSPVSFSEKIDEFSDLSHFPNIIAISADEQREIAGACSNSNVSWRLPPFIPEPAPDPRTEWTGITQAEALFDFGGIPEEVTLPSPLMLSTYYSRPDLTSTFRVDTPNDRSLFFRWWFFFGQFEVAKGFGLSKQQLEWVLGTSSSGKTPKLNGMLMLFLSMREDLRRVFCSGHEIDVKGLTSWAREHAEKEFGFTKEQLVQRAQSELAVTDIPPASSVLRAVMDAGPDFRPRQPEELRGLFDRFSQMNQIDLVLIGSAHPSNVESFRWFIAEVYFKYFASKGRNLFIVGSACEQLRDIAHPNLFLLGRCARVSPMLEASRTCPLPIVVGSGSPIKTIPALALNGAVTVTEHIDRAFGLTDYGIPAFSEPREFADDLWALLTDDKHLADRRLRAKKYVDENLTIEGYVNFWERLLASTP